jgi:fluoroacetyl-CoA thioesterase
VTIAEENAPVKQIPVGTRGTAALEVKPEHLASCAEHASLPPVLATPVMITVMGNAALAAIKPYLDAGEAAVGTRVDIRHLSPTAVGMHVIAEAKLIRIAERRLAFEVSAMDEAGQIGTGLHERVIVEVAQIARHIESKQRARAHLHKAAGGK